MASKFPKRVLIGSCDNVAYAYLHWNSYNTDFHSLIVFIRSVDQPFISADEYESVLESWQWFLTIELFMAYLL